MTELLLNAPLWLIVILAVLGLGLLFPALRAGNSNLKIAALACFGAAALLFGLRVLVPTPQKQVEKESRRLAEAVAKGDWATVSDLVKYANLLDLQGQAIADMAKRQIATHSLTSVRINSTESQRTDTIITVTLSVTSKHEKSYVDTVPSTWDMDWQKRGGSWILTEIRPRRIGPWDAAQAEQFLR